MQFLYWSATICKTWKGKNEKFETCINDNNDGNTVKLNKFNVILFLR